MAEYRVYCKHQYLKIKPQHGDKVFYFENEKETLGCDKCRVFNIGNEIWCCNVWHKKGECEK